ncbi:MAG: hypothetical protein AAF772_00770 [Acidobacteriota bacterium]
MFQLVFQVWCERTLRTDPDRALAWARQAPGFVRAWRLHERKPSAWGRFQVNAYVLRAIAHRIDGDFEAAQLDYQRALQALVQFAGHMPPSDICEVYRHYGSFGIHRRRFAFAEAALTRAMELAERIDYPEYEPDAQDVGRVHAALGQLHLSCAVSKLDVTANRVLAADSLINLATVTTFNADPAEPRAMVTELEDARVKIRARTGAISQYTLRLDWLQGLLHHRLGEHDAAAALLRQVRNRLIRKKFDRLYLIITLDLAEAERARGDWITLRRMAKRIGDVLERCADKDFPEIAPVRAWHDAVFARDETTAWSSGALEQSCLAALPYLRNVKAA